MSLDDVLRTREAPGGTHRTIKMAMRWTGASERTVKYWFAGERGPSGDHLISLARHSGAVLCIILALAGRLIMEGTGDQQAHRRGGRMFEVCNVCVIGYIEHTKQERCRAMSRTTTMTVRLGEALSDFVSANVGEDGSYENVSEYIRDLIRRDKERAEAEAFNRLKAEVAHAFAARDETYQPLTAAEVIARNRD
ncbi:MAG: hypothetical protein R8K47_02150 [Mariprofundaceae bacterium]